jgi:hypothetical protein
MSRRHLSDHGLSESEHCFPANHVGVGNAEVGVRGLSVQPDSANHCDSALPIPHSALPTLRTLLPHFCAKSGIFRSIRDFGCALRRNT